MLACAESCETAANFMLIGTEKHKAMCRLCSEICESCAQSCKELGDMQDCVEACRRCAESCRKMAA
jgi:Mg-chelatase subunit ChlD